MKRQGAHPQQCAGLMAVLKRENRDNQIMQVAQRLGVDLSDIDRKREAYESWAAVLEAHGGQAASPSLRDGVNGDAM